MERFMRRKGFLVVDNEITIGVYIPSVGRAERGMITGKLFESPKHIVRKSQEQEYKKMGFINVIGVEDNEIDGYGDVFNWIVENAKEDIIVIADDDIKAFSYLLERAYRIEDVETVQAEFERIGQILYDLDIGLAYGPATPAWYNYTCEFSFFGIPGAFKVINRKALKAKMDSELPRCTDIDFVLQELLLNRITLSVKWLVDSPYEDSTTSTSGSTYNAKGIQQAVEIMKARWGKYFSYNMKKNIPRIRVQR